ncbi:14145_t:CDS:2, partial [Racocetra persica]
VGKIKENSSSPPKKQRLHKDKHIESYMNIDESDQEDQESNSDIETNNNDIIVSRLTPPLPLNEEELCNKRLLANNEEFEELNYKILSEFEAAAWLAKHPRTMIANLELEAKALFLRTRNNTPALYTELASAEYGIFKVDKQMLALIKKVGSCFDDYRYHLFAKLRKRADECLNQFGNKRIWNTLGDFVQEAIKKIIISKLEKTDMKVALRSCDTIIVNLPIPTVLGVVAHLPVQDLLKYKTGQQRSK